ncbi:MAG: phytoene/squalene synthase family protein [Hyphomicrobiaceae bacterium]
MSTTGTDGSLVTDAVREAARRGEPDRYLAALLAPKSVRGDLAALAAFSAELARIAQIVREPMVGEIRLQWWRDALETIARGESTAHPVADALAGAMRRHHLPAALLQSLIDATSVELGIEAASDERALGAYLEAAEGALFRLTLRVLGVPDKPRLDATVSAAARAYGIARRPGRLLLALHGPELVLPGPQSGSALPGEARDALAALREEAKAALMAVRTELLAPEPGSLPALLPLVMVEPYLRAQERTADPLHDVADVAPLTRAWRIWRASMRGRI